MKSKTLLLLVSLLILFIDYSSAQMFDQSTVYAVSKKNTSNNQNSLHQYNAATNSWHLIGNTGTTNIDAIAIDNKHNILYAANGGILGKLDVQTGQFKAIGTANYGNGEVGRFYLNNIDGLTYCAITNTLYANHHRPGDYAGTNDLLFKIDPKNGSIFQNAMIDSKGNAADYAVIEAVPAGKECCVELFGVSDLALHPVSNQLYVIQSNKDNQDLLTTINTSNGKNIDIVYDLNGNDCKGLTFSPFGELLGTSTLLNNFLIVNTQFQFVQSLSTFNLDQSYQEFHSIAFAGPYNDLALKITLDPNEKKPIYQENDIVTCVVTIYNQGNIPIHYIELINHIPNGLSLSDDLWIDYGNYAIRQLDTMLIPGDSVSTTIQLKVELAEPGILTNTVEILASKNNEILDPSLSVFSLLDIDSTADEMADNDTNVVNDMITQGGEKIMEDEDDHDIVIVEIAASTKDCLSEIILTEDQKISANYQAQQDIFSTSVINNDIKISFEAGSCITLHHNFEVKMSADFVANIATCE